MQKVLILWFFVFSISVVAQKSDFKTIDFSKADKTATFYKNEELFELTKLTYNLTKNASTDVEKFRAIYFWICHNISNDHRMYAKNNRKRKKYVKDSVNLTKWNSTFKKSLFKKLIQKKNYYLYWIFFFTKTNV